MTNSGGTALARQDKAALPGQAVDVRRLDRRLSRPAIVVLGSYFALALLFVGLPPGLHIQQFLFTLGGKYYPLFYWKDSTIFVWFYEWWLYAFQHGLNPLITDFATFPVPMNLSHATPIPTLAILFSPITLILGPVASYNIAQFLTPVCNSFAAYLLNRRLCDSAPAAAVGALFFGFSPYVFGHLPLHPNLSFVALLPLGFYVFLCWQAHEISDRRFYLLGAALILAQAGISLELLAYSALAGLLIAICNYKAIDGRMLRVLAGTGIIAVTALAPFLYYFFFYSAPGEIPTYSGGVDLAYVVQPLPYVLLHGAMPDFRTVDAPEETLYLGAPLLLLLVLFWRRIPVVYHVLWIGFALAALGSPIVWNQHILPIYNPIAAVVHGLPLMSHSVPQRFSVMVYLALSVIIAKISTIARRRDKALLVIALASFIPNPNYGTWLNLNAGWTSRSTAQFMPAAFRSAEFRHDITGGNYIVVPIQGLGQLWQANSDMNFRALGAYMGLYDPTMSTPAAPDGYLINPLANRGKGVADKKWASDLSAFCIANHIDGILFDTDPWAPKKVPPVLVAAGWNEQKFGQILLLRPPTTSRSQ